MRLYLIRHGQSIDNFDMEYPGTYQVEDLYGDPELSDIGVSQARLLADFLAQPEPEKGLIPPPVRGVESSWRGGDVQDVEGFGITHVYSSPHIRAMATALTAASLLGIKPAVLEDLCEFQGNWTRDPHTQEIIGLPGPDRKYLAGRFPEFEFPDGFGEEPWWGGRTENSNQCRDRAQRLIAELLRRHSGTDNNVAAFTHSHFYNAFLFSLLEIPSDCGVWFAFNNAAITRIDFGDKETSLMYQNRVDFLPTALIT
ncbi:MAG: histidine phosphatase family protein [Pyrinomonadaceae bacterium]